MFNNAWLMFLVWSMLYWDGNRMASILVFGYIWVMTCGCKKKTNTVGCDASGGAKIDNC